MQKTFLFLVRVKLIKERIFYKIPADFYFSKEWKVTTPHYLFNFHSF